MDKLIDRVTVLIAFLAVSYWLVSWIAARLAEVAR